MEVVADLHLHSKYSRAVSPQMIVSQMAKWAQKKGIDLLATSDWTHPLWLRELKESLKEVEEGIYGLKDSSSKTLFLLGTEISSIYSQEGQSHRIHNLVFAPNFEIVDKINSKLRSLGANLFSDGRPIINLSSIELADLVFSCSSDCFIIPAHIWTPWFSLYGSSSGFDSFSECFGDFTSQIYGIETGLSSNPLMNWRISDLDRKSILSFSDAHSLQKLGREVTVFKSNKKKINYKDILKAIKKDKDSSCKIIYTIEFYPEEGKYHYSGHRNCNVIRSPKQIEKLGNICSVCGRNLTIGVMSQVENLAERKIEEKELKINKDTFGVRWINYKNRPGYIMMVPLQEIIAEAFGCGVSSKKVEDEYNLLTNDFTSEFNFLLKTPLSKIEKVGGKRLALALKKVREGKISFKPGYDGVFGEVGIWSKEDQNKKEKEKQMNLF